MAEIFYVSMKSVEVFQFSTSSNYLFIIFDSNPIHLIEYFGTVVGIGSYMVNSNIVRLDPCFSKCEYFHPVLSERSTKNNNSWEPLQTS
jgi:hypothetical protein